MMVLVDTTVWIDFFAARSLPHVVAFNISFFSGNAGKIYL